MRTTLNLPEDLLAEARAALGTKTKTDTIVLALREAVRSYRIEDLISMMGKTQIRKIPRNRRPT